MSIETTDTVLPQPLTEQTEKIEKKSTNLKNFVFIGISLFLVFIFFVFAWGLQTRESIQLQNRVAPDFTLPTFEGEDLRLSDLRGQVVVINFWASWCVECYREAALLEQAYRDYKDKGVLFIGVDYLDTEKEALKYMAKYDITYPSGPDIGKEIAEVYLITGVPETFFIDQDGHIKHVQIGPITAEPLYNLLDEMVANN